MLARRKSLMKRKTMESLGLIARFKILDHSAEKKSIVQNLREQHNEDIMEATMTSKTTIAEKPHTLLIRLEFDDKVAYEPGDHVAFYPENPDVDVNLILAHMSGLPADPQTNIVQLQEPVDGFGTDSSFNDLVVNVVNDFVTLFSGWQAVSSGLPSAPLRRLLKHHLCLQTTPNQMILRTLSMQAKDPKEKDRLLLMGRDYKVYDTWRANEPSMADLFRSFPSLKVDAAQLVSLLRPLMPRYYSIASSPQYTLMNDGSVKTSKRSHVDLLLNVVEYTTRGGIDRKGLCSNHINDMAVGGKAAVFLRSAPAFHLPKLGVEDDVPLILVGAGSGLAPFRGFWEQVCLESSCVDLEEQKAIQSAPSRENKLQLFYGCINRKADLLRDETDVLAKDLLTRHSAFSRFIFVSFFSILFSNSISEKPASRKSTSRTWSRRRRSLSSTCS